MARNKTAQGGISLRRKVTAWLAAILLVTMLSTGIATMAGQWTVRSFDTLLADNAVCYTVQNALKDEAQAFARYVRQPTSETEQAYTAACTASEQSLAALPFDYVRIGEERYARTWNLLQGYAGYRQERDAFLQLSPSADTYIGQMYHVMALQDYLAEYALRLTQATLEQVREAARLAQIDDFILSLPQGYDTKVGAMGSRFSGGERQRIAIARAILKDAPILILDEATSAADPENQVEIDRAIENLCRGKTVLIVAHRLGAVKMCDKVAVVEDHTITCCGTHAEVLEQNSYYRKAWADYRAARSITYSVKGGQDDDK